MSQFDRNIIDLIESSARNFKALPLNLGAVQGSGGGIGAPPGGYIGWLPQTRVAYDEEELATLATSPSGSLLDNLNHIRARINAVEASGVGGTVTVVDDNTSSTYTLIDTLHFVGSGVVVTDLGGGDVQIEIDATGGGGLSEATADTLYLRLDTANNPLTNSLDIIPTAADTYGFYVEVQGDATVADIEQYGGSVQVNADLIFAYQEAGSANVSGIMLDGVRWRTGAGVFTNKWVHLETQNVTQFEIDKDGYVTASGVEALSSTAGFVIKSPNGTRWRITIDNAGSLTTTAL
jgi:hypothetical protein